MSIETIRTERLLLKPYSPADENVMAALLTDESIRKFFILPEFNSADEVSAMFKKLCAYSLSDEHFERGIYLDGVLIGFVNDCGISEKSIELGYVISSEHRNRGYATEMFKAVIAALFEHGFDEITACSFSDNGASRRVLEKCGMELNEKTDAIEYRGEKRDCVYYAIQKSCS